MQFNLLKRREFIMVVGGAAVALPLTTRAQQKAVPVIGFLDSGSQVANAHLVAALREGLNETGYAEGQNVIIEYRWANGEYDRLPVLAAELASIPVSVFATGGGEPAAHAAKAASTSIPIVFDAARNPVELGWVATPNRTGGNMAGVSQMVEELATKELVLLHELVPQTQIIAILVDPNFPTTKAVVRNAEMVMRTLECKLQVLRAGSDEDIERAFRILAQQHIKALFVAPAPFYYDRRDQIIGLAAHHGIPTLYVSREFAAGGGLMSYGSSLSDIYRQIGVYAGRVLKGEKPADPPVVQPIKSELVINLKTAQALRLSAPAALLARADEVIA
jgi:putative ABC transport system substrate-binding protein